MLTRKQPTSIQVKPTQESSYYKPVPSILFINRSCDKAILLFSKVMISTYLLIAFLSIFCSCWAKKDYEKYCGLSNQRSNFIVNGEESRKNQWPWMVSIYLRDPDIKTRYHYQCAGVLIHKNLVLTAAHCTVNDGDEYDDEDEGVCEDFSSFFCEDQEDRCGESSFVDSTCMKTCGHCKEAISKSKLINPRELMVVTGEYRLSRKDKGEKRIIVKKIHRHSKTLRDDEVNSRDLAILELDGYNRNSAVARPACLPAKSQGPFNRNWGCMALGWGQTKPGDLAGAMLCDTQFPFLCEPIVVMVQEVDSMLSDKLRQVNVPVWKQSSCRNAWAEEDGVIDSSMFCAGRTYNKRKSHARGPCTGDSGGPLICSKDSKTWYVMGLVSWGGKPCLQDLPAVFSNVAYVSDFIRDVVKKRGLKLLPPKPKSNRRRTK